MDKRIKKIVAKEILILFATFLLMGLIVLIIYAVSYYYQNVNDKIRQELYQVDDEIDLMDGSFVKFRRSDSKSLELAEDFEMVFTINDTTIFRNDLMLFKKYVNKNENYWAERSFDNSINYIKDTSYLIQSKITYSEIYANIDSSYNIIKGDIFVKAYSYEDYLKYKFDNYKSFLHLEYNRTSDWYKYQIGNSRWENLFYPISLVLLSIVYPLRFLFLIIRWAIKTIKD
jgi:hypothetical protein